MTLSTATESLLDQQLAGSHQTVRTSHRTCGLDRLMFGCLGSRNHLSTGPEGLEDLEYQFSAGPLLRYVCVPVRHTHFHAYRMEVK